MIGRSYQFHVGWPQLLAEGRGFLKQLVVMVEEKVVEGKLSLVVVMPLVGNHFVHLFIFF
jgi:hypothetical protein